MPDFRHATMIAAAMFFPDAYAADAFADAQSMRERRRSVVACAQR